MEPYAIVSTNARFAGEVVGNWRKAGYWAEAIPDNGKYAIDPSRAMELNNHYGLDYDWVMCHNFDVFVWK